MSLWVSECSRRFEKSVLERLKKCTVVYMSFHLFGRVQEFTEFRLQSSRFGLFNK